MFSDDDTRKPITLRAGMLMNERGQRRLWLVAILCRERHRSKSREAEAEEEDTAGIEGSDQEETCLQEEEPKENEPVKGTDPAKGAL
ncbi:hypothetical protein Hypma_002493 [Hypsizygus marmoreus]|uniref:Uncharacterized protein n=1 Tax=Hypsizygus marmoreus TaxID=39966 RepID=A0A369JB48_HYPMA|nr:hypothetical protein Hypma_002493 [Hypsizygus marmoreus]